MQNYKDLEVYQIAHKVAVEIHFMSLDLPKFEMYEEGRQIRKSSKDIVSKYSRGFWKKTVSVRIC